MSKELEYVLTELEEADKALGMINLIAEALDDYICKLYNRHRELEQEYMGAQDSADM